jgi:hypothetical protein
MPILLAGCDQVEPMERPMTAKAKHSWTEDDDLVALYISRHKTRALPLMQAGISKRLGMSEGSLARRQSNFKYLDEGRGLSHSAKQSRRIHQRYKNATESELRPMVLRVLEPKLGEPAHNGGKL